MLKSFVVAAAFVATIAGAPAQAAIIFSDNFDADNATSALNFNALLNWTVEDGTIDYIRSGGFGISCVGGTGGCLDMDGSTANAGRILSTQVFTLDPGVTYTLSLDVSGNQRGGASDAFSFGFWDGAPFSSVSISAISPAQSFTTYAFALTVTSTETVRLFVEGAGGDNIGVILDNVVFSDDQAAQAPEPASLLLMGVALMGAARVRRRR